MAKKAYHHVTRDLRCQIAALKSICLSQRKIAQEIGVSQSTISREIARNSNGCEYSAPEADSASANRRSKAARVPKKLKGNLGLKIRKCIEKDWSPEQISGRLKLEQGLAVVSHETIYRYIRTNRANGGLLYQHLRHGNKKYRKYSSKQAGAKLIQNRVDISERPAIVDTKSTFGHWEGDTIISHGSKTPLVKVVERKSKFSKIKKVKNKTKEIVVEVIVNILKSLKNQVDSITYDNGGEFAGHSEVAKKLKAKTYFATPYHSWERGLNEHTNGLIRQYLPKKFDFKDVSDKKIREIENKLNNRLRKVLYAIHYEWSL
ncbi:IS30 family transposase [Alphaproteobacteria bacterium]|nr:IS30 family transposase [Alphaproteobacteria bacterium]